MLPEPRRSARAAARPSPSSEPAPSDEGGLAFGIRKIARERRRARARGSQRLARDDLERRATSTCTRASAAAGEPIEIEGSLAEVKGGALEVAGALSLEAELDSLGADASGPFTIDARAARVRLRRRLHTSPRARRPKLRGRIARGAAGALGDRAISCSSSRTSSRAARCSTAPRTRAALAADAFALDGWEALVPRARHGEADAGAIAIPKLALVDRSARGCAARSRSTISSRRRPTAAPIALRGALELLGSELRTRDLVARAAEQPIRVDATRDAAVRRRPRYEVVVRDQRRRHQRAARRAMRSQPDRLYGPLDLKGTLARHHCGRARRSSTRSRATSRSTSKVGGSSGASLLEAVLGSLGRAISEARAPAGRQGLGALHDATSSSRCAARSTIANGQLVTAPVTLDLSGLGRAARRARSGSPISRSISTGRLTIGEALDAALARAFGARDGYVPADAARSSSPPCAASSAHPRCSSPAAR